MALRLSSLPSRHQLFPSFTFSPSRPSISSTRLPHGHQINNPSARLCISSTHSTSFTELTTNSKPVTEPNPTPAPQTFDWFSQWYPLALLRDLDKRSPKGLTVLGLDLVIWWDRVEGAWKVFEDRCPHRLAPLSEGRIDHRGRLQCVYHGWCFNGAGACKYIPQAPALGPPVHMNEKACVAAYPSIEQNGLLWFWPNSSSQYKDVMHKTKPPYFPVLDDPTFTYTTSARDVLYGYEILTENIVDPAHLAYAHYGIMDLKKREDPGRVENDREGGTPLELTIEESDINGFVAKQDTGYHTFIAPCVYYFSLSKNLPEGDKASVNEPRIVTFFLCVPVRPGKSRIISITGRNYATSFDKFVPRWYYHIGFNLVIDSDLYLLHTAERRLASEGISNWHNACYVPTQSDVMVVTYKKWLKKYSNNQVNWGTKSFAPLPANLSREQLMNRYWTHVVHCKSCSRALKGLKIMKISLRVISIALIGILAATNHNLTSNSTKGIIAIVAVLCFFASHWLSQFIYKIFYYHDYNHSIYRTGNTLLGRLIGSI